MWCITQICPKALKKQGDRSIVREMGEVCFYLFILCSNGTFTSLRGSERWKMLAFKRQGLTLPSHEYLERFHPRKFKYLSDFGFYDHVSGVAGYGYAACLHCNRVCSSPNVGDKPLVFRQCLFLLHVSLLVAVFKSLNLFQEPDNNRPRWHCPQVCSSP